MYSEEEFSLSTSSQVPTPEGQALSTSPRTHAISQPTLSGSDRFLEVGGKIVETVAEYRMPILGGIIGIFAVAFGYSGYQSYQSGRNEDGFEAIYKATAQMPGQQDELARMGINLNDVPRAPEEQAERKAKAEEAAVALQAVGADYSGLSAGQHALVERAQLLEVAGKPDEALKAWQDAVNGTSEPTYHFRALNGLGNAFRSEKKFEQAAQQYEKARSTLTGLWKELATLELAKTYELAGDVTKATGLYEELSNQTPASKFADDASARVAALKTAPAPAAPAEGAPVAPAEGTSSTSTGTGGAQ